VRARSVFDVGLTREELIDLYWRLMYRVTFQPNSCWTWKGRKTKRAARRLAYGRLSVRGWAMYAHVVLYELKRGKRIPRNLVLRHTCNNSLCCNYSHMKPGSQRTNVRDAIRCGSHWSPRGAAHPKARLDAQKVQQVRALQHQHTRKELAEMMRVSLSTINRVISGALWRHA
jgi:hypothetical protein